MGLLDGLEKLINEHGSAVILKERIALANDKYAALESKAKNLEEENSRLRADLKALREQNAALQGQVAQKAADRLDEEREKVLMALAQNAEVFAENLAGALGMNPQVVEFHLSELVEAEYATAGYSYLDPTRYRLGHEGRRYLIKHGLLK